MRAARCYWLAWQPVDQLAQGGTQALRGSGEDVVAADAAGDQVRFLAELLEDRKLLVDHLPGLRTGTGQVEDSPGTAALGRQRRPHLTDVAVER
jgi:hypothetical protein